MQREYLLVKDHICIVTDIKIVTLEAMGLPSSNQEMTGLIPFRATSQLFSAAVLEPANQKGGAAKRRDSQLDQWESLQTAQLTSQHAKANEE